MVIKTTELKKTERSELFCEKLTNEMESKIGIGDRDKESRVEEKL